MKTGVFERNRVAARACLFLAAVVLSSCAHTKFLNTWRDPAYRGQPKKILVQSVGKDPTVRIIFENRLVEQLKARGVSALAGHEFLPGSAIVNRQELRRLVEAKAMDAVFITGPTNRKDLESLRPGELSYAAAVYEDQEIAYDNYESFINGVVYSTGTYAGETVFMEMVLYDAASKKRIWSALSRTYVWDSGVDEIKPMVGEIMKMLEAAKIVP